MGRHQTRQAGIGLRAPHVAELIARRPSLGLVEVHAENYMGGGPAPAALETVRRDYPVSVHGVGLSLGSAEGVCPRHLARLAAVVRRFEPALVSEHLSWSVAGGAYLNDLAPLPFTEEALDVICRNVDAVQTALGRPILLENPSSYLAFSASSLSEPEFLGEVVRRTGCFILCDVNNIVVSAHNLGLDAAAYLAALPAGAVREIHLAGHARNEAAGRIILIDDHGSPAPPPVWRLYAQALRRFGGVPTIVEWDTELPTLDTLLAQAELADASARALSEDGHAVAA